MQESAVRKSFRLVFRRTAKDYLRLMVTNNILQKTKCGMHEPAGIDSLKSQDVPQDRSRLILVAGASGFIGSRLVRHLAEKGIHVRAMSRRRMICIPGVTNVYADAFEPEHLAKALDGIGIAYYLLHSMEGGKEHWREFAERERRQAENFARVAGTTGVKRIIYLGGLVNASLGLSEHMQSRQQVGRILAGSGVPVTELRASMIIGPGSSSYEMLRYLAERLPVMICPKWVESLAQPIAVDDVVAYLAECIKHLETVGQVFEIGGPDVLSYKELLLAYGAYANKNIRIIQLPFLTTKLSSYWVDLVTPVAASIARPLIDSLVHDTIVTNNEITKVIPLKLHSVADAIDMATRERVRSCPVSQIDDVATHTRNSKILIALLLTMSILGSSYYWLDVRPEVYNAAWLFASSTWFAAITVAIRFVNYGTRLGYLVAGGLSWFALGFWLLDSFHVAFDRSLIASEPDLAMTVRNLVGTGVAALCIALSHNTFHKIRRSVLTLHGQSLR